MTLLLRLGIFLLLLVLPTSFVRSQTLGHKTRAPKKAIITKRSDIPPPPTELTRVVDPSETRTLGVTVEKYIDDIAVNADGTSTQTWELQQRLTTAYAVSRYSRFERPFNGDLESIEAWDAYILKADGTKVAVPDSDIRIQKTPQAEAAPAFSSMMMIEMDFKAAQIGDAIHYKARLKTLKPYFGDHFDRIDYLSAVLDWTSAEIDLSAPSDYPLYIQAVGLQGGKLPDENGRARWQWKETNVKALEIEDSMNDLISLSPRVAITNYKNYDELGAAYWAEAEKKAALTPEIQKLADNITKGASTPEKQASAIYEWVNKNIRYLSLVIERSGWVPHSSTEILANRYGDCKDYTTVLNSLLRAKGIVSYPVIIRADLSDWFPDVAVPSYFNHAILYIPSLDLFADATAPNTRLGLIPQQIVGRKAFLAGSKTGVISTPSDKPDDNQLLSDVDITVTPEGNLTALSKNTFQGRNEILFRPIFEGVSTNSDDFVAIMLSYYGIRGKGKITHFGNPFEVKDPFTLDMEVDLDHYTTFTATGTFRIPPGLNLINIFEIQRLVHAEKRKTSLVLGAMRFSEKYNVTFPNGVIADISPAPVEFSNSVGSYHSEARFEGKKITIVHELVIKKDEVSAEEYPQARELFEKASSAFSNDIKYHASRDLFRAAAQDVAKQTSPPATMLDVLTDRFAYRTLSPAEARQFEARLIKDPDDLEIRTHLIRFYTDFHTRELPARIKARIRHNLWFIEHHPEMDEKEVLGVQSFSMSSKDAEFTTIKNAWLKKLDADPANDRVRINAYAYIDRNDAPAAEKILLEGMKLSPDNFEFPLLLSKGFHATPNVLKPETAAARELRQKKELDYGEIAISLLKKERSRSRNVERKSLLENLAVAALDTKNYDAAKSMATELILDFGQSAEDSNYDDAAHIGNIILGRVALRENDRAKAAEYLLIAIRAPLRREKSWLPEIDTVLAKELFAAGEKDAVLQYLSLCENLWNLKNEKALFDYQAKALRLWQDQIKNGKTPTFDFQKP